jgi:hypothetical protein
VALVRYLFAGNKFAQIVGEEDESVINILTKPYMVGCEARLAYEVLIVS